MAAERSRHIVSSRLLDQLHNTRDRYEASEISPEGYRWLQGLLLAKIKEAMK
jgi:hypothetical protein